MKKFSPSEQCFFDCSLSYQSLPDDLIDVSDDQHSQLLNAINQGCVIGADLQPSPPRPSAYHDYIDGSWQLTTTKKQEATAQVWEQIKQKRYQNTHAGVYVPSVNKWFHTNEESRTQYLALQLLPQLPDGLQWKTMDNSFIAMTKELVTQITLAVLSKEQQDFANAEKHKKAMEASDNPMAYDYSTGWSDSYE